MGKAYVGKMDVSCSDEKGRCHQHVYTSKCKVRTVWTIIHHHERLNQPAMTPLHLNEVLVFQKDLFINPVSIK